MQQHISTILYIILLISNSNKSLNQKLPLFYFSIVSGKFLIMIANYFANTYFDNKIDNLYMQTDRLKYFLFILPELVCDDIT